MNVQAQIEELNQHPLNQAARSRLLKEGGAPNSNQMFILQLAEYGLEDEYHPGQPAEPDDPQREPLQDYMLNPQRQKYALKVLEPELTLDEVENDPLPKLAESVAWLLKAPPPEYPYP